MLSESSYRNVDGFRYVFVGRVWTDTGHNVELLCSEKPQLAHLQLLRHLCNYIGRIVDEGFLADQLSVNQNSLHITASRLRRILHHDWYLGHCNNQGFRLSHIGNPLADADWTYLEFCENGYRERTLHRQSRWYPVPVRSSVPAVRARL